MYVQPPCLEIITSLVKTMTLGSSWSSTTPSSSGSDDIKLLSRLACQHPQLPWHPEDIPHSLEDMALFSGRGNYPEERLPVAGTIAINEIERGKRCNSNQATFYS
jgi:hypothetical protein